MAKRQLNMKIDQQFSDKLQSLSQAAGKTKTAIVEEAIANLTADSKQDHQQVELLSKQNEQLKLMMQATQAVVSEKTNTIQTKDDLISELRVQLHDLRARRRTFWQRLFNLK